MQKEILLDFLNQNRTSCAYAMDQVNSGNRHLKLNENTASVGFIFRHIAESINMFGFFFGVPTEVRNTTMGQTDTGKDYDIENSRALIEQGYAMLQKLIENTPDAGWLEQIDTPFFGAVSKARLFSHILYHNSHHCGQISLALKRAKA